MKDIMELFTGANLWAWAFIVAGVVVLGAISNYQKRASGFGKTTPKQ